MQADLALVCVGHLLALHSMLVTASFMRTALNLHGVKILSNVEVRIQVQSMSLTVVLATLGRGFWGLNAWSSGSDISSLERLILQKPYKP